MSILAVLQIWTNTLKLDNYHSFKKILDFLSLSKHAKHCYIHVQKDQLSVFFLPFLVKSGLFGVNLDHFQTNTIKKFGSETKSEKNGPNGFWYSSHYNNKHKYNLSIHVLMISPCLRFVFCCYVCAWLSSN